MADLDISTTDGVLWLTLNRPDHLNALTGAMAQSLSHELEEAVADEAVRVVVLTGAAGAFSAGADLTGLDEEDVRFEEVMAGAARMIRAVPRLDKPVVAAVNGVAAGVSCALALACDVVVAGESASFLLPFTRLGLMPDGGSSATVAASIGRARAMRMGLLAEPLTAQEAYDAGLVTHLAADDELDRVVDRLVGRLVAGPPLALAATKRAINDATLGQLEPALEREARGQALLAATTDFAEGVAAFVGKRRPAFRGE
jgi:enoyl-CoA hydratase